MKNYINKTETLLHAAAAITLVLVNILHLLHIY